jgi:vesicle transport protein SEC22
LLTTDRDSNSYLLQDQLVFLCICDRSYPRKLAFTYLADLQSEFTTLYPASEYLSASCRPYAFVKFDTFIQRTKKTYQDSRATQNLDKLNDELKDVTKVMTKNIEDLLYRGDSLNRMGEQSARLKEDSRKYKRAAVRINWELLLKQVSRGILASARDGLGRRNGHRPRPSLVQLLTFGQYGPVGALIFIVIVFIWWRFL